MIYISRLFTLPLPTTGAQNLQTMVNKELAEEEVIHKQCGAKDLPISGGLSYCRYYHIQRPTGDLGPKHKSSYDRQFLQLPSAFCLQIVLGRTVRCTLFHPPLLFSTFPRLLPSFPAR